VSAATAAWQTAWRAIATREVGAFLVMTIPSGPTLKLSTKDEINDFGFWEPVLQADGSVTCPGAFLDTREAPATLRFSVFDKKLSLASGLTMSAVVEQYDVQAASVSLYLHEDSVTFAANALLRFTGKVQSIKLGLGVVEFTAIQDRSWNKPITIKTVNRSDDPQAPDDAMGAPKPVIYGRISGPPARPPIDEIDTGVDGQYGDLYRIHELIRGGTRATPAVLVDSGRGNGSNRAKVLVASHAVKQLGNFTPDWGSSPMFEGKDGLLHTMDPSSGNVFNDSTLGAGWYVGEDATVAFLPLAPVEIETTSNYCDNPLPLLDPKSEFNPAIFNWSGSKRNLLVRFAASEALGALHATASVAYVIYRASSATANLQFRIQNTAIPQGSGATTLPATTGLQFRSLALAYPGSPTYWSPDPWLFSNWQLIVEYQGTGAGSAEIFAVGCAIAYYPRRDRYDTRRKTISIPVKKKRPGSSILSRRYTVYEQREVLEDVTEVRGRFFANVLGYADDGSGTYTGVAAALIERVPDILRHLLAIYGGTSAVATGSAFGSLITARDYLKTWHQRDMLAALYVAETIDVATAIEWLCDAGLAQPILSEFIATWQLHPWRGASPDATYLKPLSWENLVGDDGITVEFPPPASVLSAVRLNYGHDAHSGTYLHECSVSASRSVAGYLYRNLRDGYLTIVSSVNDRLDFNTGGGVKSASLTPGTYDPWDLVKHVSAAMETAEGGSFFPAFYGPRFETGFNDDFQFQDPTVRNVSINGDFATFEDACAALQTAINAVSSNWTVTYSRTTNRVTVDRSSGTKILAVGSSDCGWAGFGIFFNAATLTCPVTGVPVEEQRVVLGQHTMNAAFTLLWRTGTNGLLGTKRDCAELLGFDRTSDLSGINAFVAHCPKMTIEGTLEAADARFGGKRELPIDCRSIYDSATARQLRNRLVALLATPRATIEFSSEVHADLRRGDVFEVSTDVDAFQPCPIPGSAGLWAGRRFRVLETRQRFGSSWHTDVVAIDVTD